MNLLVRGRPTIAPRLRGGQSGGGLISRRGPRVHSAHDRERGRPRADQHGLRHRHARGSAAPARGGRREREAAGIGGARPEYETEEDLQASEAERPLAEGGEGVEEGFEIAEDDLEEAASHEENRYAPQEHDFGDEESAGDADVESGEADEYEKPD